MCTTQCNAEVAEFIRQNYKNRSNAELTALINKTFNKNLKVSSVKRYKNLENLKSGIDTKFRTKFKKGTEKVIQSYNKVKVNSHLWLQKSRVIWEKHNGKIPEGYKVTHLDGNKLNDDLSNLALISDSELGGLRTYGKSPKNAQLRKAQINVVRLKNKIKELSKEK